MIHTWFSKFDFIAQWWNPHTLIYPAPPDVWQFKWVYVAFIGLCAIGFVVNAFLAIDPLLKNRIRNLLLVNVLFGLVLGFFRLEEVPYLGWDLLRFIQEVVFVLWINQIIWYYRTRYQKVVIANKVQERKNKYLPKK